MISYPVRLSRFRSHTYNLFTASDKVDLFLKKLIMRSCLACKQLSLPTMLNFGHFHLEANLTYY